MKKWRIIFFSFSVAVQYSAIRHSDGKSSASKCSALQRWFNTSMTHYCIGSTKTGALQIYSIRLDCIILNRFLLFCPPPVPRQKTKLLTSSPVPTWGGIAMRKAELWHAVRELPAHLQHVCDQLHLGSRRRACIQALKRFLWRPDWKTGVTRSPLKEPEVISHFSVAY